MYKTEIVLELPEKNYLEIIHQVLRVDKEPKATVSKCFNLEENKLTITFASVSIKSLRIAVNGFFENLNLITETINKFN